MVGVLLYILFLLIGFAYADMYFKDKDIFFRVWMGGVFGNVLLMAGIVIPALIFDFTVLSHIILLVVSIIPYIIINIKRKDNKLYKINIMSGEACVDWRVFLALVLPISLIMWVLMTNHILVTSDSGGIVSGQCTWGDLPMHLSFVTSIAEQKAFPPGYNLLAGTTLNYPFFVDMLSSSLYLFGTPLRWAVLIPSYVITLLLVLGFYILALKIVGKKSSAIIATVLFFIGGGFGFAYFIDGAKADHTVFTRLFTDFYHTPTNYNEENVRWSNTICDMIIPQRTTMAGWFTFMPALWLLLDGIQTKKRSRFIAVGILAGCMPMIHTHSFLALGLISVGLLIGYLFKAEDKKEYIINWAIFGGITVLLAFPQLIYWTFSQTSGNSSFLNFHFNWINSEDPYIWFYVKNMGIIALFAVPAILYASRDNKRLLIGCAIIMILAETIQFQPNAYDNNKLIYIVYMIMVILVSDWMVAAFGALKSVRGRVFLAALVLFVGNLSGALTIGREFNSRGELDTFTASDVQMAEYIKENTEPDAVFLTSTWLVNPVCSLAGRTVYCGSSSFVYFHGLGNEYARRDSEIRAAYSDSYDDLVSFCHENDIEYVFVGSTEQANYSLNRDALSRLELVKTIGSDTLYRVN